MQENGVDEALRATRERIEELRSRLEALSRLIWEGIDHDDPVKLELGVRFKQRYNGCRAALDTALVEMAELLGDYATGSSGDVPESESAASAPTTIKEPIGTAVNKDLLEAKVPFGFMLEGRTFTSPSAWPLFYESVLVELYRREPDKFSHLAAPQTHFEYQGRPLFAPQRDRLEDPMPVADDLYAEVDMDPPVLLDVIGRLIRALDYPLDTFKVLLKEKNRGTVETISLAA